MNQLREGQNEPEEGIVSWPRRGSGAYHRTLLHLGPIIGLCIDSELIKYFPSLGPRVPLFSQSGPWPTPSGLVLWTPRWAH